jgi:hypothetical protein
MQSMRALLNPKAIAAMGASQQAELTVRRSAKARGKKLSRK